MHATLTRLLCAATLLLSACASNSGAPRNVQFDFGPATPGAPGAHSTIMALVVTDVTGPSVFDSERMYYRLNYADPLQALAYNQSRWASTPLQMLTQRLKSRIAQTGTKVLTATDASNGVLILRSEIDEFTHSFDSATASYGQVVLRVSLLNQHKLVDQETFSRKVAAASADAGGGARALAAATDGVAADLNAWLATLPTAQR